MDEDRTQADVWCEKCGRQAPWTGNCSQHCDPTWLSRFHGWFRGKKGLHYCPVCLEQDGYEKVVCSGKDKEEKICEICQEEEWF